MRLEICLAHWRLTLRSFLNSRPPCQNRDLWACWLHHRGPDHCYRCPRTGTIQGVPLGFRRISCQVEVLLNDLQGTFCIKTMGLKGFPVQIKPDSTDQKDLDIFWWLFLLKDDHATSKTVTLQATSNHIRLHKRSQWNNGVQYDSPGPSSTHPHVCFIGLQERTHALDIRHEENQAPPCSHGSWINLL